MSSPLSKSEGSNSERKGYQNGLSERTNLEMMTYNIVNVIFISAAAPTRTEAIRHYSFDHQMVASELVFSWIDRAATTRCLTTSVKTGKVEHLSIFPQDFFTLSFAVTLLQFFNGSNKTLTVAKAIDAHFLFFEMRESSR